MNPLDLPAPSPAESRQLLRNHAAEKGAALHAFYGPRVGWAELARVLADRRFARFPTEILFDASPLLPGEPAHAVPCGPRSADGFRVHVHPVFQTELDRVPYLVLYQLVAINYGSVAGPEEAELFGAAALGLPRDDYYDALCQMADRLAASGEQRQSEHRS